MRDRLDEVVRGLAAACLRDDISAVRAALDTDAVAVCDGGVSLHGAWEVAQLVAVLLCGQADAELTVESVNGRAGLALRRAGRAVAVVAVAAAGARVTDLWIVLNPAKLAGWHRR